MMYFDSIHIYDDDRVLININIWENPSTGDRPIIAGYHEPYCWLGHPSAPPSDRLLEAARVAFGLNGWIMAQTHASGSTCWITEIRIHQRHINPR